MWARRRAREASAGYRSALVRLLECRGPSELADCDRCDGGGSDGDQPCQVCHGTGTVVLD
ncbi:MAG: hypothetical protein U0835_15980 [Isosphaeraceae bacterium]